MPEISLAESAVIPAPAAVLYRMIADYRVSHPSILPRPPFGELTVEEGGYGAGTVIRYTLRIAGKERTARAVVAEPEPGRVLTERDLATGMLTTFSFEEVEGGTRATFRTEWNTPGLKGWIEKLLVPGMLRKVYREELANLARAAAASPLPQ